MSEKPEMTEENLVRRQREARRRIHDLRDICGQQSLNTETAERSAASGLNASYEVRERGLTGSVKSFMKDFARIGAGECGCRLEKTCFRFEAIVGLNLRPSRAYASPHGPLTAADLSPQWLRTESRLRPGRNSQLRDMLRDQGVTENSARNFWQYRLTLRDVKNEDRPGYVYENKGDDDKMSS